MNSKTAAASALLVGTLGASLGGMTSPADAATYFRWGGSAASPSHGGRDVWAGIADNRQLKDYVSVKFHAGWRSGLNVTDHWRDGKGVRAYLRIAGAGTWVLPAGHHDLGIAAGKKVSVKVCVNGGPCSNWQSGGIT